MPRQAGSTRRNREAKGTAATRDEPLIDLDDTDPDVAAELEKDGKRPPKL